MTDLICRKTMMRCQTQGMCAPFGGCQPSVLADCKTTQSNSSAAQSPAGVDGLEVVTVRVCGYAPGLGQVTVQLPDGEYRNWSRRLELGEHVQVSVNPPDAQAITDGLRGEVDRLSLPYTKMCEQLWAAQQQRDQLAGLLREAAEEIRDLSVAADKMYGGRTLLGLRDDNDSSVSFADRIDAALAELPK